MLRRLASAHPASYWIWNMDWRSTSRFHRRRQMRPPRKICGAITKDGATSTTAGTSRVEGDSVIATQEWLRPPNIKNVTYAEGGSDKTSPTTSTSCWAMKQSTKYGAPSRRMGNITPNGAPSRQVGPLHERWGIINGRNELELELEIELDL